MPEGLRALLRSLQAQQEVQAVMKRTFSGWWAALESGRVVQIAASQEVLLGAWTREQIVRCRVVLETERKPSRLGRRAQARREAGGPRVVGRPSVSLGEWEALKVRLATRSDGRCEVPGCIEPASDPHHVVACSAGGADAMENLVAISRNCHGRVTGPVAHGRLIIQASGNHLGIYGFRFRLVWPERADPLGDRTFYDIADERVPDDRAEKFWKMFGGLLPPAEKLGG